MTHSGGGDRPAPPLMALGDITVLDLSHALAGPFASTMLASYGAEVLKIESPDGGDIARAWGPPFYQAESAYFVNLNPNKKSVAIDLKHPEGRELFFRLVERADVVLENLRIGTVDKLGVGYQAARARNPGIVYCSISGFGQDGPYRDRAALDLVLQAEGGMISVTGEAGQGGVRCGVSIADITAGMYAAFGILTALHARQHTGRGQFVDVSMLEAQLGILQNVIGAYVADGIVPRPTGNAYPTIFPYQTFRTATRDLALGIPSNKGWRSLCRCLGLETMASDPNYATNAARSSNRTTLIASLQSVFLTKSYEEWEAILVPAGVPIGAINSIDAVVHHPQVKARGALAECDHPVAGRITVVGPPVQLSETPGTVREPAPLLGQHTRTVLTTRLALDEDAIERLQRIGAIGVRAAEPERRAPAADRPTTASGPPTGG
jgi:crotonobetainyl-CoA:carnitine CoA-transferase CaiB-like acyl-CoA transferase